MEIITVILCIIAYFIGRRHGYVSGVRKAIHLAVDNIKKTLKKEGLNDAAIDRFFGAMSEHIKP